MKRNWNGEPPPSRGRPDTLLFWDRRILGKEYLPEHREDSLRAVSDQMLGSQGVAPPPGSCPSSRELPLWGCRELQLGSQGVAPPPAVLTTDIVVSFGRNKNAKKRGTREHRRTTASTTTTDARSLFLTWTKNWCYTQYRNGKFRNIPELLCTVEQESSPTQSATTTRHENVAFNSSHIQVQRLREWLVGWLVD